MRGKMKIQISVLRVFLFLFIPLTYNAQTYPFVNYGVQDGLAQSNISGIVQDRQGFLWIATESGVSKFDGKTFINYTTENGLASNNVSALLLDGKGNVWMGHENGGLTKYNGKGFVQVTSDLLPKDKKIYSLSQERSGSIWISTAASGAIKILDPEVINSPSNFKSYSSKEGLDQYVFFAIEDRAGTIWYLTGIGIKYFDKNTNKFEFFRPAGMPMGQVTSINSDNKGNLLIGTSTGCISRYDPEKKTFEEIIKPGTIAGNMGGGANFVYTIYEDRVGNIWATILNYGVCRWSVSDRKLTFFNSTNGLAVDKIKCIAEDREGNILLGTIGEGFEIFKGEKFVSFSKKNGLVNDQVYTICKDKNSNYWFGTNDGISVYDPKATADKAFKTISLGILGGNSARSIVQDKNGNMWIGTYGAKLFMYDVSKSAFGNISDINEYVNVLVNCLLVDSKNNLWIGTVEGVVRADLNNRSVKVYRTVDGLSDNDISCLFEDSKGNIWIGTKQKGISMFNGTSFKIMNKENGLTYQSVTSICEDTKKRIWIGTEGGGAFVYNNGVYQNYKMKDGLVSDFITLVNTDKNGNVWLGTNKGLSKYSDSEQRFYSYLKNEGFTGIETKPNAVYNDNDGNIWFGTVNGVFKYNQAKDIANVLEPLTQITRFRVNLKDYPLDSIVNLSYKENSLYFEFVGISLSGPDQVKYKMMLENYDETWLPLTSQSFQVYSNLPHGKYVFKLEACNSNGVCNANPITIRIVITPPFWKTWWFYAGIIIIGLFILFTYIKIRERSLKLEKKILEEKVRERTAEVVEKNKELDEKNKDITASIRYAKRIQDAILPPDEFVKKFLPKTFVLFKPKDIVSGDFYWLADKKDIVLFAAVDCTGHGVPGAFMSIVGHNLLDQIVNEQHLTQPAAILDALNKSVSDTLRQSYTEDNAVRDGMDINLCAFDRRTNVLEYAGAFNPLWLVRNGEVIEYKADKFPIGNLKPGENKKFTNNSIPLQKGDTLYLFSDGYADQFGGPKGKKLKYSTFQKMLLDTQHMSMEEQGEYLNKAIEEWRGTLEQVDDVLVIGTRL